MIMGNFEDRPDSKSEIAISDWRNVGADSEFVCLTIFRVILKTGDQREVHVRFDEALNAAKLIQFIL
jgi:hypothetical protein